ncbi:hypothetical protein ACOMHN_047541 [Nucella lapillus]
MYTHHPDFLYIGSSVNLRHRWSNHKSDCKLRKGHKCHVAQHFLDKQHPVDPQFTCLRIFAIEAVHKKENLEQVWSPWYNSSPGHSDSVENETLDRIAQSSSL